MKQKILVLLGRYFPKASANTICTQNILELLPKDKYDIEIICYDDGLPVDTNYKITRIKREFLYDLGYILERKNDDISKRFLSFISFFQKIRMIPFLIIWPWNDPIFTYKVYRIAKKLYSKEKHDYVLSIHMPISSLIVGSKLKRKYPDINFIPIFWDSLSAGVPLSIFSLEWNTNHKLKWERKLLKNADKIVVMEASRSHHIKFSSDQEYYSKFIYLDIPLLVCNNHKKYHNPFSNSKINIVFCGTANFPMRNIDFFAKIAKCLETIDDRINFYIIGNCNCTQLFTSSNIIYCHEIPHDKLIPYIACSDVLLNFGVKTPAAISGKIFEYMAYAKPIISTYSIENEACIPYLKKYPKALLINEKNTDYLQQAKTIANFINDAIKTEIDIEEIKRIYKNNMPQTFVSSLFDQNY